MKNLYKVLYFLLLCTITSCGSNDEPNNEDSNPDKVKIYLTYTFDTSSGGNMARSASTNEEVFNEFYEEIKTGKLLAPFYNITFTNIDNGVTYNFKGNWADNEFVTLRTGTYNVTGYSTATGDNIQDKCSIVFDEQINISITSKIVTLNAKYNCSLLIFNDEAIQSLHNYNGEDSTSFYSFKSYKYAFVNDCVYKVPFKNEAYIIGKYTNDAEFLIYTGNLNFEKGKYYVYNSISNSLSFSPMTEGLSAEQTNITTVIFDKDVQPIYAGGFINNYSKEKFTRKGIIVSTHSDYVELPQNPQFEIANLVSHSNYYSDNNSGYSDNNSDFRIIDCSNINEENFNCGLLYLEGNKDYYVRAFAITDEGIIIYGNIETIHSQSFDRYSGKADVANVWHAFDYTLFDLTTDEIIDPHKGFYYSTNESPHTVHYQKGTGYNTCYKFATEWNYKLWYYHNTEFCDLGKVVSIPKMKMVDGKLEITKNENDNDKSISIYYCIDGNGNRPEDFTNRYTSPISITKGQTIYCYAISSDGYISYTNRYYVN